MGSFLHCQNVTIYRGDNCALDGINLEIDLGQNTAIVGPNGSGKTTLLKGLSRELYPVKAPNSKLLIFGQARWNVWELWGRLGIVSAELQTAYTQTYVSTCVGRQVVLSGYSAGVGPVDESQMTEHQINRAEELIEALEIEPLQNRSIGTMSTGQQRRFLLARALIHDPEVLVLDEPTVGLDIPSTFRHLKTIRKLVQQGKTIVQVTHHIDEIPPEIDRVVLLDQGRIVADGPKAEVLTAPKLSQLFGVAIKVVCESGFYRALPAD